MTNTSLTISAALEAGTRQLAGFGADARREAEFLLAAALACNRGDLLARREREVEEAAARRYRASLVRRAQGEPLAYVTGRKEFWSLELDVDARVLVPRAETELLVEFALQVVPVDAHVRVLDLGTGSAHRRTAERGAARARQRALRDRRLVRAGRRDALRADRLESPVRRLRR